MLTDDLAREAADLVSPESSDAEIWDAVEAVVPKEAQFLLFVLQEDPHLIEENARNCDETSKLLHLIHDVVAGTVYVEVLDLLGF